jgi:hypothetical protein
MLRGQLGAGVVDEPGRGDGVGLLLRVGRYRSGRAVIARAASGRLRPPIRTSRSMYGFGK